MDSELRLVQDPQTIRVPSKLQVSPISDSFPCAKCGRENARQLCSKCKVFVYCSRACQEANWKDHKGRCKRVLKKYQAAENEISPLEQWTGSFGSDAPSDMLNWRVNMDWICSGFAEVIIWAFGNESRSS